MSKLLRRRRWVTLQEAAHHLERQFNEPVSVGDVLQLALDRELKLSVQLDAPARAQPMKEIPESEAPTIPGIPAPGREEPIGIPLRDGFVLIEDGEIVLARGLYDLEMRWGGLRHVEVMCREAQSLPVPDRLIAIGIFIANQDGVLLKLMSLEWPKGEPEPRHFLADKLPEASVIVVRTEELTALMEKVEKSHAGIRHELPVELPNERRSGAERRANWPWGDHSTKLLDLMAEAGHNFWSTYDPGNNRTAPTNAEVEEWLVGRGVPRSTAAKMATILRADDLPSGPRT